MTNILLIVNLVCLVAVVTLLLMLLRKTSKSDAPLLASRLDAFEKAQERTERAVREEVALSRDELGKAAREQRKELTDALKTFGDSVVQRMMDVASMQKGQLDTFSGQLSSFAKASGERLDAVRAESATTAKQLREEVVTTLSSISETITKTMTELASAQKTQFEAFANQLATFAKASGERLDGVRAESATGAKQLREEVVTTLKSISETMAATMKDLAVAEKVQLESISLAIGKFSDSSEKKLEAVRVTVEAKLQSMQVDNAKQLEQMRQTVDEKLQGTLEKRLGESFKQVSERLEQVHKGLGEMQTLATGVGDLKKVLTNVKTRGTWGEMQLGALLEEVLNPDQFSANVATKGGNERVEFAVKFPGQSGDKEEIVWLPIDAKFPVEDYQRLIEAQEKTDVEGVDLAGKQLENRVKACAKDICEKYLNPPKTTDFGILFLPIEGLFAEVIRRPALAEIIQREFRVVIAGPTTLWSILNSLQMGFRTLSIQKRSIEVWNLLAGVKTEWTKYGDVLDVVQQKLHQASDTLEKAKVRSRAVGRKLKDVQELPASEAIALLPQNEVEDDTEAVEKDNEAGN
jgi:DNA recombination protein RmuC